MNIIFHMSSSPSLQVSLKVQKYGILQLMQTSGKLHLHQVEDLECCRRAKYEHDFLSSVLKSSPKVKFYTHHYNNAQQNKFSDKKMNFQSDIDTSRAVCAFYTQWCEASASHGSGVLQVRQSVCTDYNSPAMQPTIQNTSGIRDDQCIIQGRSPINV